MNIILKQEEQKIYDAIDKDKLHLILFKILNEKKFYQLIY